MLFQDSLVNIVSGMGTDRDKITAGRFASRFLDQGELKALYENDWVAAKIVDAPADDETREWRGWNGGPKQVAALDAAERALKVRQRVNRARKMARLSGGAIILIGTGDPDPSQPLDVNGIRRGGILYLHALSRWDVSSGPIERDMLSPYFGAPSYYEIFSAAGRSVRLHPSRAIRFTGQLQLDQTTSFDGWGLSILQRVYDAVRNAATVVGNLASLTNEAKVDVFGVPNLNSLAADPTFRANVLARFQLVNVGKSINNSVLRDAAEQWDQKQISFAHHSEVMWAFLEIVAGAADIPATRMLGTSPKGMSATGASDTRNYYDRLSSGQVLDLSPALHPLDIALARHAGVNPSSVSPFFYPLWQMTEAEQAAIGLQKAQSAEIMATLGVMPKSAMRAAIQGMLLADNTYPGLADALAKAVEAGEPDEPLILPPQKVEKPSATARVVKT